MAPGGITECIVKWDSSYCWEKVIEVIVDMALIFLTSFQLYLHCKLQFSVCRVKYWLYYLIILSALCHFIHQFLYQYFFLFDLSTFFFNIYFTTILYYAGVKLLQKTGEETKVLRIIKGLYWLIFVLHLVLFIISLSTLVTHVQKCVGLWYLIVRTIGVILAIGLCLIGKFHQNRANKKIEEFGNIATIHNPMPHIWCWVGVNIIAQFINLIRTFVFAFVKSLDCEYDKDNTQLNYFIQLLFLLIIFYLPMFSTVYVFWQPMKCGKNRGESFMTERQSALRGMELMTVDRDSL